MSEKPRISSSWDSGSISTKVSAASSLGSSRNSRGSTVSSMSSKTAATSAGFMVIRISRRVEYFFPSMSAARVLSMVTVVSAIALPPSYPVGERKAQGKASQPLTATETAVRSGTGDPSPVPPVL